MYELIGADSVESLVLDKAIERMSAKTAARPTNDPVTAHESAGNVDAASGSGEVPHDDKPMRLGRGKSSSGS